MGFMEGYNMTAGNRQLRLQEREASDRSALAWRQLAEQADEREKKLTQESKAAELFLLNDEERLRAIGKTPEQVKNASAQEQIGWAQGYMQSQATRQVMQQIAQQEAAARHSAAFSKAMSDVSRSSMEVPMLVGPQLTVPTTRTPTASEAWRALAAEPGALQAKEAAPFMQAIMQGQDPSTALNARANWLNAQVNFQRANATKNGAEYPDVPGYTKVPNGDGGFRYLSTRPSPAQVAQIQTLSNTRAGLAAQIAALDLEINSNNAKPGLDKWPWTKSYADRKKELQAELSRVDEQLSELKQGSPAPAKSGAGGGGSLWEDFMKSQK